MPGEPGSSVELPFHRLSAASLRALARGGGDAAAVAEILAAERSRRLLHLRALDEGVSAGDAPQAYGTALSHRDAWALLECVQRQASKVFEDVLMSPSTGMWVSPRAASDAGPTPVTRRRFRPPTHCEPVQGCALPPP